MLEQITTFEETKAFSKRKAFSFSVWNDSISTCNTIVCCYQNDISRLRSVSMSHCGHFRLSCLVIIRLIKCQNVMTTLELQMHLHYY